MAGAIMDSSESQAQSKSKRETITLAVVSVSLWISSFVLGVASVSLWMSSPLFSSISKPKGQGKFSDIHFSEIGNFSLIRNDARRRAEDGRSWVSAKVGTLVLDGDTIATGTDSKVVIDFDGGSTIEASPKTLFTVIKRGSVFGIDLKFGTVRGYLSNKTTLGIIDSDVQWHRFEGAGAEIVLAKKTNSDSTSLQVTSDQSIRLYKFSPAQNREGSTEYGHFGLNDKQSSTSRRQAENELTNETPAIQLTNAEIAHFAPGSDPIVSPTQVNLEFPSPGQSLWLSSDETLEFRWSLSGGSVNLPVVFEMADEPTFANPILQAPIAQTTISQVNGSAGTEHERSYLLSGADRPDGIFFWRIVPQAPDATPSIPAEIAFFQDVAPEISKPRDGETFFIYRDQTRDVAGGQTDTRSPESDQPSRPIILSWIDQAGSTSWDLELASDRKFANKITSKRVTQQIFKTDPLLPGKYYWRVKGMNPERSNPHWSKPASFTIQDPEHKPLRTRSLASTHPEIDHPKIEFTESEKSARSNSLDSGSVPSSSNQGDRGQNVEMNTVRVDSFEADGVVSNSSPAADSVTNQTYLQGAPRTTLDARIPSPQLEEPQQESAIVSLTNASVDVEFRWRPVKNARSYTLQIASDENFSQLLEESSIKSTSFPYMGALPEGRLYWRVRANKKYTNSNWSSISDFTVVYP